MLSEFQIETIITAAGSAYQHNNCPTNKKTNFLLMLREFITESGLRENVCPACLGTGKADGNKRRKA